jgi:hypothetical protein
MKKKRTRTPDTFFALFLLGLTFAFYWPAFRVFFSLDDLQFLWSASGLGPHAAGLRRILSTRLFFDAAWRLFGDHPWPYHLVVLLFHAANASVLYLIARRLNLKKPQAYIASMLFVTTYVAFVPLHWISGIQEVTAAFFALVAAYSFLGKTNASMVACLAAGCLSVLCKDSSFLVIPALAIVFPVSMRRRWILGAGGLLIGLGILAASGSFAFRPRGDPYETSVGTNIIWNLLTYSAWLVRFWDDFPDKTPRYDPHLFAWGIILPALLLFVAWRVKNARTAIARATVLSLFALAPVLPLVRHSYFYYLYVPLIPFWMLAGAYLGGMSRRYLAGTILALFILISIVNGVRHRGAEIRPGVPEDPILRYALTAEHAVTSLRAGGNIEPGDYLILVRPKNAPIDLATRQGAAEQRVRFALADQALLGGKALRLFFPGIREVRFEYESAPVPGWQHMHLCLTYRLGMMRALGYGEDGRFLLAQKSYEQGVYGQAKGELLILLDLRPDDPKYLYLLGEVSRRLGDADGLRAASQRLEAIAGKEGGAGVARRLLDQLKAGR